MSEANPNGSVNAIAGLCNVTRNVVGLMPHPERSCEDVVGSAEGLVIFKSVVQAVTSGLQDSGPIEPLLEEDELK